MYDREVGYCQGSPFITGLLLLQVRDVHTLPAVRHVKSIYRMFDVLCQVVALWMERDVCSLVHKCVQLGSGAREQGCLM